MPGRGSKNWLISTGETWEAVEPVFPIAPLELLATHKGIAAYCFAAPNQEE